MAGAVPDSIDTPLMRQYLEVKDKYPDCIVFFRLGDFYEMFFDDAVVVARALDLTLTSRDKGKENPVPMCGVPHHSAKHYLGKLVELGFRVAICEQVEDPKAARGIVRREVVRVVTPGVVLEEEHLEAKAPCYLACAIVEAGEAGVAHLDVSTGEFAATALPEGELTDELARLQPREVLAAGFDPARMKARVRAAWGVPPASAPADAAASRALVEEVLGRELDARAFASLALRAGAAVLAYARETQPRGRLPVTQLRPYRAADHLILDEATRANLELFQTIQGARRQGSLLGVLDETRTSMGGRLLRRWLAAPLVEVARIRRRHDALAWLVEHAALRGELRGELAEIYDLERLAARATLGVASPRDLVALARSLERLPGVRARLQESFTARDARLDHPELLVMGEDLAADVAERVRGVLSDDPPAVWREGGFCRRGYSAELDELLDLSEGGKNKIAEIETRERERTGIASLKIRYNRVFGYYLEITRSNLDRVPADYVRKQTLANAERFTTPELREMEGRVRGAAERAAALERELFAGVRQAVLEHAPAIRAAAEAVAELDALASLAEVAREGGWVRPEVDPEEGLEIRAGRHPVLEAVLARAGGEFVPNDTSLGSSETRLLVLTGPNMSGKSTYLRQVALLVLMAQMGSFVPAASARIGVVDRVFTRVGASDRLARGESTFMVEMRETAAILAQASRRSLVILDEIGRGTSTFDGLSIAWAVAEHLHDAPGLCPRTLFATHYHELADLARTKARVANAHFAAREWGEQVIFLRQLVPGSASRSYGIEVARLAGLPAPVLERARAILHNLESGELDERGRPRLAGGASLPAPQAQLPLFTSHAPAPEETEVLRQLRGLDPERVTPLEALEILARLVARLGGGSGGRA
jgi:DNA mismatch repair protein MutS